MDEICILDHDGGQFDIFSLFAHTLSFPAGPIPQSRDTSRLWSVFLVPRKPTSGGGGLLGVLVDSYDESNTRESLTGLILKLTAIIHGFTASFSAARFPAPAGSDPHAEEQTSTDLAGSKNLFPAFYKAEPILTHTVGGTMSNNMYLLRRLHKKNDFIPAGPIPGASGSLIKLETLALSNSRLIGKMCGLCIPFCLVVGRSTRLLRQRVGE